MKGSALADVTIRRELTEGNLVISPLEKYQIQPASVDVRIDRQFRIPIDDGIEFIDITKPLPDAEIVEIGEGGFYLVPPRKLVLGSTIEWVRVPAYMRMELNGRSSFARVGLFIHVTGGFIDPGFEGNITLEIYNARPVPIGLRYGMRIAQVSLDYLTEPAQSLYRGKYKGQRGPTESRIHKDFETKS